LAQQDDREEMAALKISEHKAGSEVSIRAERAVRDQKEADYKRLEGAGKAISQAELQAAALEVVVASARIELAEHQHQEDILTLARDQISISKMKMTAPFDGVIQMIYVRKNESTDGVNKPILRIIQNDPLYVEVPVPIAEAHRLKKGDDAFVSIQVGNNPNGPAWEKRTGRVLVVNPQADTGSQTIQVRVEVPNPTKTPSGGIVYVNFGPSNVARN
jgi:multidrug efflux pump subunit AcrA (membrane-fusion protein)